MRRVAFAFGLLVTGFLTTAQAQVTLKLKASPGTSLTYELTQNSSQTMTVAGSEYKSQVDYGATQRMITGKADSQGQVPIEVKTEALRSIIGLPSGKTFQFDSAAGISKTDVPELEPLLNTLEVITSAPFKLVADADGRIQSISGVQELIDKASPKGRELIKREMSLERLQKERQRQLDAMPTEPVKVGDSWQRTEDIDFGGGQTLSVERTYQYQGPVEKNGQHLERIDSKIKKVLSFAFGENALVPEGLKIAKTELEVVDSRGSILLDNVRGITMDDGSMLHLKGKLTLTFDGQELPTELDLEINRNSIVKP